MHLGMIGGFGPAATSDYYLRLVAAAEQEGVPLRLTIVHGDMRSVLERISAGNLESQLDLFARQAEALRAVGADVAILVSLSQHVWLDEIAARTSLPFCSLLTALADHIARTGIERVGVIGSSQAMSDNVLGAYGGLDCLVPEDDEVRTTLHRTYFEIALTRRCTDAQRAVFDTAARQLMDRGAEMILLGGTDLSIAYAETPPGFPAIDPVQVHVDSLRPILSA